MDNISNYYNTLAPAYDHSRFGNSYGRFIHAQEHRALTRMLHGVSSANTLDLACGTGRLLGLADTGLDLSPQMLAEARNKYPEKNLLAGDATRMPFPDQSFDAVFSLHFVMHLAPEQTRPVLAEVWRVLRPGGRFVFDFPSRKRRQLTGGHHDSNWHGSNAFSMQDFEKMTIDNWQVADNQGILFLPVHRIPTRLRLLLAPFDTMLCRSPLKEYASYLLVCMVKKL
ncbi:MAG: class I SAM-dependent methyltransferase [Lewinellaceae bacterium]|nr:class I SAM-dependent methyltransferase [Lewinellaceae bacterium]